MDGSEARLLLATLLQPYREVGYQQLRHMIGRSEIVVASGLTGVQYRLECVVSRAPSRANTLTVSGIASEIDARHRLPDRIALGFDIRSDGSIH
jgi:hypothetical protein